MTMFRAALSLCIFMLVVSADDQARSATSASLIGASVPRANDKATDAVIERLARRVAVRADRTLDILILSGGAQNGAYGAGFLRGWQARRRSLTAPRAAPSR